MRVFLPRLPKSVARHLPVRVLLFLALLMGLVIAYWHITKRYPLINEYQRKIESIYSFQDEVQLLKNQYPESLLHATETGYLNVIDIIFTNQEHFQLWTDYFQKRAANYGLDMAQKFITNRTYKTPKTDIKQLSIQFELKPSKINIPIPPHERLLMFLHELSTNQYKKIDMVELKALGDGTNFDHAIIGLQVWFFTNAP